MEKKDYYALISEMIDCGGVISVSKEDVEEFRESGSGYAVFRIEGPSHDIAAKFIDIVKSLKELISWDKWGLSDSMVFIIYYSPDESVTEEIINGISAVLQQECDSREFRWGLFVKEATSSNKAEIFAVGLRGKQEKS